MKGTLRLRILMALIVGLLGLAWALPSFVGKDSALNAILPEDEINLGLDLKGGVNLTLEVDVPKAVEYSLGQMGQDIKAAVRDEKVVIYADYLPRGTYEWICANRRMTDGFGTSWP